jgi:hypothetical protein
MILDAALVAALMQDKELRTCIDDMGAKPAAYLASSWEFRRVALRSGERMIVAIAKTGCLVSQNSALRVYRETGTAYRLVLSDNALPETVDASSDGTISSAAHDTIDTIVEPVYVWNGSKYVFAPERSHVYDVSVEQRRPYQIPVRFASGASSTMLRGTFAENFGNTYVFIAKAGQRATIDLLGRRPGIVLSFGDREIALPEGNRWSGKLPFSGTYSLDVFGLNLPDHRTLLPYAVRLTIQGSE